LMNDKKESRKIRFAFLLWGSVVLVAAGLAVLIGLGLCERRAGRATKAIAEVELEQKQKTVRVAVMRVQPRRVLDVMELPSMVEAFAVADLAVERGGRIVDLPVDKGQKVAAGDLMLRLDSRTSEQSVRQAEILFHEAEREVARWKELQQTGAVSESDFDAIRKGRDLAEVGLEQARISLSQCEVRAPTAGIVDARHVEVGEYASEGQAVFRIVDVDRLKLSMDVPELDVMAIENGKTVRFSVPAAGDREYTGTVSFVAAMASPGSKSYRTEILVENPDVLLKPGMIANASLTRRILDDAIVVPLSAVVPRKGEHVVFTVEDGYSVRHIVHIRSITAKDAVLSSGITAGELLVVAGQRTLQDGAPVEFEEGTDGL